MRTIFKSLYWICYNIASLLCFIFFFDCEACGILTPQPGTEPTDPPTSPLEDEALNNGLRGKSLSRFYKR